jgi:hypothetical protein
MSVRGVLLGALALAALQMVVSNDARAQRLGSLATTVGGFITSFLSPSIPAIPDRRGTAPATAPASSSTGGPPSGSPPITPAPTGSRPV